MPQDGTLKVKVDSTWKYAGLTNPSGGTLNVATEGATGIPSPEPGGLGGGWDDFNEDGGHVFLLGEYSPPLDEVHVVFTWAYNLGTVQVPTDWHVLGSGSIIGIDWVALWNRSDGNVDDKMGASAIAPGNPSHRVTARFLPGTTAGWEPTLLAVTSTELGPGHTFVTEGPNGEPAWWNVMAGINNWTGSNPFPYFKGFDSDQNHGVLANVANFGRSIVIGGREIGVYNTPGVATNTISPGRTGTNGSFVSVAFGWTQGGGGGGGGSSTVWHTCDNDELPPPGGTAGDGGCEPGWAHVSWMRSKSGGPGSGRTGRMKIRVS